MSTGVEKVQLLMDSTAAWSDKTFDGGKFTKKRCVPISYHLQKESKELTEALEEYFINPNAENRVKVKSEFADNLILICDCATHFGMNAHELLAEGFDKLNINKHRVWGTPNENGVVEHVREGEEK